MISTDKSPKTWSSLSMLQPLLALSAAQTVSSPKNGRACLNLSALKHDRIVHGPLHTVAEHALAHGCRCSDFPSHCCPQLLPITALRAGRWLFCGLSSTRHCREEAVRCEGRTNKSHTEACGNRSGTEGGEYMKELKERLIMLTVREVGRAGWN